MLHFTFESATYDQQNITFDETTESHWVDAAQKASIAWERIVDFRKTILDHASEENQMILQNSIREAESQRTQFAADVTYAKANIANFNFNNVKNSKYKNTETMSAAAIKTVEAWEKVIKAKQAALEFANEADREKLTRELHKAQAKKAEFENNVIAERDKCTVS